MLSLAQVSLSSVMHVQVAVSSSDRAHYTRVSYVGTPSITVHDARHSARTSLRCNTQASDAQVDGRR